MVTLDDLRQRAHPAAPEAAVATVRLDSDEDVPSLFALFAADEPPSAVRLVIGGEPAGELSRDDVLEFFPRRQGVRLLGRGSRPRRGAGERLPVRSPLLPGQRLPCEPGGDAEVRSRPPAEV